MATIVIDCIDGNIVLTLHDEQGVVVDKQSVMPQRHSPAGQAGVDNLLLTAIDNLIERNTMDKRVFRSVRVGQGIDKDSVLYRIVSAVALAITPSL